MHAPLGIPLCPEHTKALRPMLVPGAEPEPPAEVVVPKPRFPMIDPTGSVVYYISRTGTTGIKIGVSQNVHKRMRTLGSSARPCHLLAIEPGGYAEERKRHAQFRALREPGTEWFRQTDWLMQHISNMVFRYGQPRCNCQASSGRRRPAGM